MNRWIPLGEQFTRCGPCLLLLPCAGRADDCPGVERDADDRVVTGGREVWFPAACRMLVRSCHGWSVVSVKLAAGSGPGWSPKSHPGAAAISGQVRVTRPVMAIVTVSPGRAGAWARP